MTGEAVVTFVVTGMHCASCGLLVDDVVEDVSGVRSCTTSARRGRTVVRFDPDSTSAGTIVAAIEAVGYRAEPV